MTTAYTSLLGLALPVTGELSGTWGDTVNTAITSLLDSAVAGTTSITTDADITLTTTTGASNQARQAIILWNPASGTVTRNITAPAQSKMYTVINASGGTQSIVIRGVGPTTGVTVLKGESALVAWNGSDFVKVSSIGGSLTLLDLTVTGNTILGDAAADTLTVNATTSFTSPVKLPSTGRSAAAALTVTNPAFLYGVASTYTDTTSSGTIAAMAPFYGLAQPTLSTSNVTTYTNAATLYIANAPTAGGSATITNPYSIYVAAGAAYFGGGIVNSGLTSGRVVYSTTGGLETDSANFVFDGTNVGIGTSSPGYKLHVANSSATSTTLLANILARLQSNASGADASLQFSDNVANSAGISLNQGALVFSIAGGSVGRFDTSGNLGLNNNTYLQYKNTSGTYLSMLGIDASNNFSYGPSGAFTGAHLWYSSGAERMRIDSSGNVGIGASTLTAKLTINGNTIAYGSAPYYALGAAYNDTTAYLQYTASTKQLNIQCADGTTGGFTTFGTGNGNERMRIDSSGNVGIGTSSPASKLNVESASAESVRIGYSSTKTARLGVTSAGNLQVYAFDSTTVNYTNILLAVDGSTSAGKLLVGTTSTSYGMKMTVDGGISSIGVNQFNIAGTASGSDFEWVLRQGSRQLFYVTNATVVANLSATGVWTNASDARYKENIVDSQYGLSTVMALKPRAYNLINQTDKPQIGFIAQEVLEVIPEVVESVHNAVTEEDRYTLSYGNMVAVLTKAIQEQQALIVSMREELDALKTKVGA